jgi:hypothetical protein
MAKGVRDAILAHAGEQNLVRITRMSAKQGPFWDFSGFDLVNGELKAMSIPTLSSDSSLQAFNHGFGVMAESQVEPPSASVDDVSLLFDAEKAEALGVEARAAALSKLVRLENPAKHSPDTVDCVSCHVTTPITKVVLDELGWATVDVEDAYVADAKLFAAADLAPTFESSEPLTNVHAFSYGPDGVGINQRVVNESAAVVAYLLEQDFSAK